MKILETETEIKCQWTLVEKKLVRSIECDRIEWLRKNYLIEMARDNSEWLVLYKDPKDKRLWELYFEFSEMQGGGPPSLRNISEEEAITKYKL